MTDNKAPTLTPEQRARKITAENVIDRVLDRKSYIPLKNSGQSKTRAFLIMVGILGCLPFIALIAQMTGYDPKGYEFVTLACIFLFILIGCIAIILGALLIKGAGASKTNDFIFDNESILQHYFIDFIKAKLPSHGETYSTMFEILTCVEDSSVDSRSLKMVGLCRFRRQTTELTVTLRFNPSYTKLYVDNYNLGGLE